MRRAASPAERPAWHAHWDDATSESIWRRISAAMILATSSFGAIGRVSSSVHTIGLFAQCKVHHKPQDHLDVWLAP